MKYKGRCYHARSLNSNEGWNSLGCQSFMNQPILKYSNEIRSAVHTDLYDNLDVIPFDKMQKFLEENGVC